ncbi:copper resistance protein B [Salinicola rhizosphaerae]|uniref:Copper resistance protein B n=1 Tax=Salinicola rhizosphaerae TaxID=1443141 RepID=A0ABQ3EBH9_9GAMM|nr:copper resistance protein B [Salinicola rhizosphaerae]GHB29541.1 hypothetical protein GCM10009038_30280 [Salinicola rhizosphaerae]
MHDRRSCSYPRLVTAFGIDGATPTLSSLLVASWIIAASTPAWANPPPGKASLDAVVPENADPSSGAPASWGPPIHDTANYSNITLDRLEYRHDDVGEGYLWDAEGWYGNDLDKFWWKTEGEGDWRTGQSESAELQALYDRKLDDFWDVQLGLRHDIDPHPSRTYAVLGLQGLAPYGIDTEASLFVSERGDTSARVEFEYEWLLTQRWILSPRFEINASADRVADYEIGQGINSTETGLRLSYDVTKMFSPYVGLSWENVYGETRRMRPNDEADRLSLVLGISAWY